MIPLLSLSYYCSSIVNCLKLILPDEEGPIEFAAVDLLASTFFMKVKVSMAWGLEIAPLSQINDLLACNKAALEMKYSKKTSAARAYITKCL